MPQFLTIRLWVSSEEKKKSKADVQLGFYTHPYWGMLIFL